MLGLLAGLLFTIIAVVARPAWEDRGSYGAPLRSFLVDKVSAARKGRHLLESSAQAVGRFERLSLEEELQSHGYVFGTIICNDEMEGGVTVLHESLLRQNHRQPLVVLGAKEVSQQVRRKLARLALVKMFHVEEAVCGNRRAGCEQLKLLFFTLGVKVVFLEYDTVVLGSLEELGEAGGFSGVREAHVGLFETAMMVLEGDMEVYRVLQDEFCKGNESDHEIIRRVVPDEAWNELDDTYHVPSDHMDTLWYRRVVLVPKVIHYKGNVKPWNWWRNGQGEGFSMEAFRMWCEVARGSEFECGGKGEMERGLMMNGWSDKKRLTILLSTFNRKSWVGLVRHYTSFKFVSQVVLIWQDPWGEAPLAAGLGLKVVVWQAGQDSLNNRFFAPGNVSECVYVCDDDIKVKEEQLWRGFQIWKGHARRLVGYFPRRWMNESPWYSARVQDGYNIVLTKGVFTHRAFLYMYVELLPKRVKDIVEQKGNCEDILFNMMVSGFTGSSPLHILVEGRIVDMGHGGGISGGGAHFSTRFECVQQLISELGLTHAPLTTGSLSEKPLKNKERE